jgi:methanogenic corrinoid protein MtbC1
MSPAWTSALSNDTASVNGLLSNLVYRSRAVNPLSAPELHELALAAQSRNRNEAVTGLVLYDDDHFFQWLEGPTESLERIMRSIWNDPRHTDIEVLHNQPIATRAFGDWNMKLAAQGPNSVSWRAEVIEPPREVIEDLRQHPDAAPALLVKLIPVVATDKDLIAEAESHGVPNRQIAAILKSVIVAAVLPEVAQLNGLGRPEARVNPRTRDLADLLIAADSQAAIQLIQELQAGAESLRPLYSSLIEPVARSLGDLWDEDGCSEVDVTLGLVRMQTAIRLLNAGSPAQLSPTLHAPAVLIAPEPGELHGLGAALDSDLLRHAGLAPHCAFPANDKALQDLVAKQWFDVLDLSLSAAFRREHWLPRVTRTIAQARQASCNPALMVIVGGRVFVEQRDAGSSVGADLASTTATRVPAMILGCLQPQDVNGATGSTKSQSMAPTKGTPQSRATRSKGKSWQASAPQLHPS